MEITVTTIPLIPLYAPRVFLWVSLFPITEGMWDENFSEVTEELALGWFIMLIGVAYA